MKTRYCALALLIALMLGILGVLFLLPVPESTVDVAEINDLIQSGHIIDQAAFAGMQAQWQQYRMRLQIGMIALLFFTLLVSALSLFVVHRNVLRPFQRMRGFARRVAAGELDIPLEMDKRNAFGAFTESFDLMRDELRRSRESERAAQQSKRELVASLSHDIQTPVSSIRAVAELMEITAADDGQRQKLQTIQQKVGQIHTLVNDLFHTTLEELDSLSVLPAPLLSDRLEEMIAKADYRGKTTIRAIPGCLISADPVRLSQVIDNILANSYKYAGTAIDVCAEMGEDGLTLSLRDYGPGADPDELPLLCGKYYRGKAADAQNGYGLGLYIAHTLTERMGGRLACENAQPGFVVRLWLKFDGQTPKI